MWNWNVFWKLFILTNLENTFHPKSIFQLLKHVICCLMWWVLTLNYHIFKWVINIPCWLRRVWQLCEYEYHCIWTRKNASDGSNFSVKLKHTCHCMSLLNVFTVSSFLRKKIGQSRFFNDADIGITGFTMWKQKSSENCYLQWEKNLDLL